MIVCLKTRSDEIHIINWSALNGSHYTLCNKVFTNKQNIETFGADNIFPNMCRNCYIIQENSNASVVAYDVREWATDHVISNVRSEYSAIQNGWADTETKYDMVLSRHAAKTKRMLRKFPTKNTGKNKRYYEFISTKFNRFAKR